MNIINFTRKIRKIGLERVINIPDEIKSYDFGDTVTITPTNNGLMIEKIKLLPIAKDESKNKPVEPRSIDTQDFSDRNNVSKEEEGFSSLEKEGIIAIRQFKKPPLEIKELRGDNRERTRYTC
jgi:hypothetical protein